MKETQNVKMIMYDGTVVFLDKNAATYAGNKGFLNQKNNFYTQHDNMLSKAGEAGVILRGVTSMKDEAKSVLAEGCSMYCGFAFIKLNELGMHDITEKLLVNPSDYLHLSDMESGVVANNMHKILTANLADITVDYLTVLQLGDMRTMIDNFIVTKGSSTSEHTAGPVATLAFNESFKPVDEAIANVLTMGKSYKFTDPDFYNNLVAVTTLPGGHVRHTYVSLTLTNKATGLPIVDATGRIIKLKKSGKANEAGVIKMERVRHGTQEITINATGFKPITMNAAIQSGRQNDFGVEMEGIN